MTHAILGPGFLSDVPLLHSGVRRFSSVRREAGVSGCAEDHNGCSCQTQTWGILCLIHLLQDWGCGHPGYVRVANFVKVPKTASNKKLSLQLPCQPRQAQPYTSACQHRSTTTNHQEPQQCPYRLTDFARETAQPSNRCRRPRLRKSRRVH